jgi:hypothetical protein
MLDAKRIRHLIATTALILFVPGGASAALAEIHTADKAANGHPHSPTVEGRAGRGSPQSHLAAAGRRSARSAR